MRGPERSFYTLLGWVTWRAARWYVVRRLGLKRKARKGAIVLLGAAAVGGTAWAIRSRDRLGSPGPGA
ncbi:hypothetical protein PAI11_28160 [Patulibacter medicamentivorans]|uniref:Uncharacterized protein n=1 Tax=Patulibacter medicamentivorans TaxID=1097667 RepID=H0E7L2_9ACTN|nr:hypothetical protein [Patulibacter medicamentivorans]EHN10286.1 hypothetical protein PAI11_28160 [Patulibacter medicamentivorans]